MEQETMGWQWYQLDHMQVVCTLLHKDNNVSTSPLAFYSSDSVPDAQPTVSKFFILYLSGFEFWPHFNCDMVYIHYMCIVYTLSLC